MLEKEALEYLEQNLQGHRFVRTVESESDLVSLSANAKIVSLEQYQVAPNRIKQKMSLGSCESFCAYVNRFKEEGTSIYLDVGAGSFVGVLDHHIPGQAQWGDHAVRFAPQHTMEWLAWKQIHKGKMSQLDLAQFIEENLDTIIEPEPNVMLKAALEFQSNEKMTLGSTQNLDNGSVKFNFTKENVTQSVTFPHRIKVGLAVYEGEDPVEYEVRIRYRTSLEGVLTFHTSFVEDPARAERDALKEIAKTIEAETEGLHHYEASM